MNSTVFKSRYEDDVLGVHNLRYWNAILVLSLVGALAIVPIMMWGIPAGADLNNHFRFALPFYESIQEGDLHPGWLAESNGGYGDPRFRFYPPGLYYLLAASNRVVGWYVGTIFTFMLLSILGGIGVYSWARSFCSTEIAVLAGIAYIVSPYRLNEIYQASLLSEYAACSVLPFAFAFLDRVCRRGRANDIAGFSTSYALVILLHAPVAVIGSLSLFAYAILRIERAKLFPYLARLGVAVLLGLAASAFFWITVFAELSWIKGHLTNPKDYYDYSLNFLFSPGALTNRNTWYANLMGLAVMAFFAPGLLIIRKIYSSKKWHDSLIPTFALAVFSLLMTTELGRPLWAIIPGLREVQFPWRWLTITSLCGSIMLAASLPIWVERVKISFRPLHLLFGLSFLMALFFTVTQIVWDSDYLKRQQVETLLVDIRGGVSFKDWLPIWAHEVTQLQRMENKVEAGARHATIKYWKPEHRSFQISSGPPSYARIRTYFYPHWEATANGTRLQTRPSADGALLISLPPESANIELVFREPPRVSVGLMVSALAWVILAISLAFGPCTTLLKKLWSPIASNNQG